MFKNFIMVAILSALSSNVSATDRVNIFNARDLNGWKEKSFEDRTKYTLDADGLSASCNSGASSLYREMAINLNETPILNWTWTAEKTNGLGNNKERLKSGDDFVARIYAIVDKGAIIPNVYSLNYVWAQNEQKGEHWPNPFYNKAHMVVVNSVNQNGTRQTQSRNLKTDFQKYFGKNIESIDGIAIMSDCDNTGGQATAQYGNIYFSP